MRAMRDFAIHLARAAGAILRERYETHFVVEHKDTEINLVTEVDRASEALIVEAIRQRYPDHAIFAEESQGEAGPDRPAEFTLSVRQTGWIVDPLDGTVNYAHGFPMFAVSLAVQQGQDLILGVTYDPLRDELFCAERGRGATLNGRPIRVSSTSRLRDALVATGFAYRRATLPDNNVAEFTRVVLRVQGLRRAGSACLDMAYLAAGRLDGYWEMNLAPWDWAAGSLLVREAGGVVTNLDGGPWDLSQRRIAASNGLIHDELLATVRGESV